MVSALSRWDQHRRTKARASPADVGEAGRSSLESPATIVLGLPEATPTNTRITQNGRTGGLGRDIRPPVENVVLR